MKYYMRNFNPESSMNQTFYKTDFFLAKRCEPITWCKRSNIHFLPIH